MSSTHLVQHLAKHLGPAGWLTGDEAEPYCHDWLRRHQAFPLGIARPRHLAEVQQVVRWCNEAGVAITPQGGNTGMVGASVPSDESVLRDGVIIVQLGRMNNITEIDPIGRSVRAEAGVVLQALHDALEPIGLQFPLYLGSAGSAQLGGLLATNAGGSHVLRYGMMQDLTLGLEVVLPDGTCWRGDRSLLKDNTGYDLRRLFCGAEGTLGVITAAVLKLVPRPVSRVTAMLAVSSLAEATALGERIRREAGDLVSALEFMTETSLDLVQQQLPDLSVPFASLPPVAVLMELDSSSPHIDLDALAGQMFDQLLAEPQSDEASAHVLDGVMASNDTQRAAMWALREELPEAQRRLGPQLKHDVAVPVGKLASFVDETTQQIKQRWPGVIVNAFGHLADGNVHFNVSSSPENDPPLTTIDAELRQLVYDNAMSFGGTISAEHGIGRDKRRLLAHYRSHEEMQLMRTIKQAIDPRGLMNPGAVFDNG